MLLLIAENILLWKTPQFIYFLIILIIFDSFIVVQSLSHVQLFATHELQHIRLHSPSLFPWVCPLGQSCSTTISFSVVPFSSCPQSFPASRSFSSESVLHIRWPKYWSFIFSINPSNEHSGLISFRMDWLDPLTVQGTLKNPPTPEFKSINFSELSLFYGPTLTSIHDYWKTIVWPNRPLSAKL